MKRIFAMLLAVLLLLAGCAGGTGTKDAAVTAQPGSFRWAQSWAYHSPYPAVIQLSMKFLDPR